MCTKRLRVLALFSALVMRAEPGVMTAPEAAAARAAGEVILMDVRTRDEWGRDGHSRRCCAAFAGELDFTAKFARLLEIANGRPVAMICATGARSGFAAAGPGWISRGLPLQAGTRHIPEEQLSGLEQDAESPGDDDTPR